MFRGSGRLAVVALAVWALVGCDMPNRMSSAPPPVPVETPAATPVLPPPLPTPITTPPQLPEVEFLPPSFPVLTEEVGVPEYMATMFQIHTGAIKAQQPHESIPFVPIRVKDGADEACATALGTVRVGKGSKSLPMAACIHGGKVVVIKYHAPKVYQLKLDFNPHVLAGHVRDAYIAAITQMVSLRKISRDPLIAACAAGRVVGGLRDHNYLGQTEANDLFITTTGEWANVYRRARDEGTCRADLLG
jgi:hypothetical protein